MTTAFIVGADSALEKSDNTGAAASMKNISCLMIRMTCNLWSRRALAPMCSGPRRTISITILLGFGFSMKSADPFAALLNPNTSAVVRAGYVLTVSSLLHLYLVGHDSHLRMREDHLYVRKRIVAQFALRHVGKLCVQSFHSLRIDAIVILRHQRLERVCLFVFVCFPRGFLQISDRRFVRSRFACFLRLRLSKADRSYRKQRDTKKN